MKKTKKILNNSDEAEVARYWDTHDASELDWSKAEHWVFPNLKLTTAPITIRLPKGLINDFKIKANKLDVPYQALMKQALARGLNLI